MPNNQIVINEGGVITNQETYDAGSGGENGYRDWLLV